MIPHRIRELQPGDVGYVNATWMRSMADDLGIPRDDGPARARFWKENAPVVQRLAQEARVVVACAAKDPNEIMGWICAEPPGVLHFVYVRNTARRGGVAKSLVRSLEMDLKARATHHTVKGFPLVARLFDDLALEPMAGGRG